MVAALALGACGVDRDESRAEQQTSTSTTEEPPPPETVERWVTSKCEQVAFTPNSEDAASEITATGVSCEEAEAFVRIAGTRTSSGGPANVEVDGYRCVRTASADDPLPRSWYECTRGRVRITFVRS